MEPGEPTNTRRLSCVLLCEPRVLHRPQTQVSIGECRCLIAMTFDASRLGLRPQTLVHGTRVVTHLIIAVILMVIGVWDQPTGRILVIFVSGVFFWSVIELMRGTRLDVVGTVIDILTPSLVAIVTGLNPFSIHLIVASQVSGAFLVARSKAAATIGAAGLAGLVAVFLLDPTAPLVELTVTGHRVAETGLLVLGVLTIATILSILGRRMWEIRRHLAESAESQREIAETQRHFLSMVSHEVRTPLTSIVGFADVLADSGDLAHDQVSEFSGVIRLQDTHLTRLIDDVLVVLRADTGRLNVEMKPTSIRDVLQRVELSVLVEPPKRLVIEADDLMANTDPDRLFQVIRNLVENACKYGGDTIVVGAHRSGSHVCLTVRDDGEGIPVDQIEEAFGEYVQLHQWAAASKDGFGLGLPIVKHLIEAMGGTIRYDPDGGAGPGFVFEFPALDRMTSPGSAVTESVGEHSRA